MLNASTTLLNVNQISPEMYYENKSCRQRQPTWFSTSQIPPRSRSKFCLKNIKHPGPFSSYHLRPNEEDTIQSKNTKEYRKTYTTFHFFMNWPIVMENGSCFGFDNHNKINYPYSRDHHKRNGQVKYTVQYIAWKVIERTGLITHTRQNVHDKPFWSSIPSDTSA